MLLVMVRRFFVFTLFFKKINKNCCFLGLDVCVSWYYHVKGFPLYEYEGDLNDYFDKFMAVKRNERKFLKFLIKFLFFEINQGELEFGSWFDHVKA